MVLISHRTLYHLAQYFRVSTLHVEVAVVFYSKNVSKTEIQFSGSVSLITRPCSIYTSMKLNPLREIKWKIHQNSGNSKYMQPIVKCVKGKSKGNNRTYAHDVMVAILETAAMLLYQTNSVEVWLSSYVKTFFCSNKFSWRHALYYEFEITLSWIWNTTEFELAWFNCILEWLRDLSGQNCKFLKFLLSLNSLRRLFTYYGNHAWFFARPLLILDLKGWFSLAHKHMHKLAYTGVVRCWSLASFLENFTNKGH